MHRTGLGSLFIMSSRQAPGSAQKSAAIAGLARLRASAWWEPLGRLCVSLLVVLAFWSTIHPVDASGLAVQYCLAGVAIVGVVMGARFSRVGVLISGGATAVAWLLGLTFDPFMLTGIALFTVAEQRGSHLFPRAMIASMVGLFLVSLSFGVDGFEDRVRSGLLSIAVLVASWVLGARTRQARLEAAARSRAEERLALSRDVHDALSHSLGTIGMLAGVTAHVSTIDEARLRGTLREIERSARSGMSDLKLLLQQKRNATETANGAKESADEHAASCSLSRALSSIVDAVERVGVSTDLSISGDVDALPAAVRTTVYRVVQEATTNIVRHASASTATISVVASAAEVKVQVCDNGCGRTNSLQEGYGLTGMRERAQLLGGTMAVDDRQSGGLAVVVRLPFSPQIPQVEG